MHHPSRRIHGSSPLFRLKPLALACLLVVANVAAAEDSNGKLADVEVTASRENSSAQELPATYAGGQVAKGAHIGMLGNLDILDTPFSVTAYTAQTIADQQAKSVGDVLKNDPSVRMTTSDGHNAENFTVRGFSLPSTEIAFEGLYGLLPAARMPTDFIERVELFKGPAAMLSGISPSGAVGGVINVVPKRAGDTPLTRLTASYQTGSTWGLSADVARRFGEDNRLGIRFNGSYSDGGTPVDGESRRENLGSFAVDYRGRGWNVSLDAFQINQNQYNGSPMIVGFATLGRVLAAPDATTNLFQGMYANQTTAGQVLRGDLAINDQWTVYGAVGHARYDYSGVSVNGTRVVVTNASGAATGSTYGQAGSTENTVGEVGLRGSFRTGSIGHSVVLNATALRQITGTGVVSTSTSAVTNIYSPSVLRTATVPKSILKTADISNTSLGLSDTLSLLDGKVLLTAGLRAQHVESKSWAASTPTVLSARYDKDAITPSLGVVVKPWGNSTSLYANYIEGLTAGTAVGSGYTNTGEVLAPYKTKQAETGVKWDAGQFTNTVALFHITKPSAIDVLNSNSTKTLTSDGEERHRGIEWSTFGQITERVRLLGGVAYTLGKLTKVSYSSTYEGHTPAGVPKITANLGSEWDLPWISGATLEGRVVYTGRQYIDAANKLELPSWTRFDVGARQTANIYGKDVVFRANLENLTNRHYWAGYFQDGYAVIGEARTLKLSVSVDF